MLIFCEHKLLIAWTSDVLEIGYASGLFCASAFAGQAMATCIVVLDGKGLGL